MNESINPGAPETDHLARAAARNTLTDCGLGEGTAALGEILAAHSFTWETDINANGVPVRRYVMRGEWEVDPTPPAPVVATGDVVTYGEEVTTVYGIYRAGTEWIVSAVPYKALDPGQSIIYLRQENWAPGSYINTTAKCVRIVSRPTSQPDADRPRPGDVVRLTGEGGLPFLGVDRLWTVIAPRVGDESTVVRLETKAAVGQQPSGHLLVAARHVEIVERAR